MDNRNILPYSPNMMFPEFILGFHQEPEFVVDGEGHLKLVGISLVKNESLDDGEGV